MVFKMHLTSQNNPSASITIRTSYSLVWFELVQATPVGMSLEGAFARVNISFVITRKGTRQAEETLSAYTL